MPHPKIALFTILERVFDSAPTYGNERFRIPLPAALKDLKNKIGAGDGADVVLHGAFPLRRKTCLRNLLHQNLAARLVKRASHPHPLALKLGNFRLVIDVVALT